MRRVKVFGTGGIGTGIFFKLEGDMTLSRDESRLGYLTDYKDYCKGHIILHYISMLAENAEVFAIGKVGRDDQGATLINDMKAAGINTACVEATDEARTMYSVCFQYPDGAGGNITASNSACELVSPEFIEKHSCGIDERSIVLAAPEVPLESRIRLLEIGKEYGAFTVSSFLSAEAVEFEKKGGFAASDLISINMDEAIAVAGDAESAAKKMAAQNPGIKLIITAGRDGCHVFDKDEHYIIPAISTEVVSTAGAGDALVGGTVAGLINGKAFRQAVEYGAVAARFAVMSKNTIAWDATAEAVRDFAYKHYANGH